MVVVADTTVVIVTAVAEASHSLMALKTVMVRLPFMIVTHTSSVWLLVFSTAHEIILAIWDMAFSFPWHPSLFVF